jgi:hypothetical protein
MTENHFYYCSVFVNKHKLQIYIHIHTESICDSWNVKHITPLAQLVKLFCFYQAENWMLDNQQWENEYLNMHQCKYVNWK